MEWYLLFDAGCGVCTNLATQIEQESDGRILPKSLSDSDIQTLLSNARPNWKWQPTLIGIGSDGNLRVYTGLMLGVRLVTLLGLKRAWRIIHLLYKAVSLSKRLNQISLNQSRRDFLKQASSFLASAVFIMREWPQANLVTQNTSQLTSRKNGVQLRDVGQGIEIWHGFVLLPYAESPVPDIVQTAQTINLCQTHIANDISLKGMSRHFDDISQIKNRLPFNLYVSSNTSNLIFIDAEVIEYVDSSNIWAAIIRFTTSARIENDIKETQITLWSQVQFSRPYPVWPVHSLVSSSYDPITVIHPEKIDWTPNPGIMIPSDGGHVVMWLEQDILYTLVIEQDLSIEAVEEIVRSLSHQ